MKSVFILLISITCVLAHIPVFPNTTKITSFVDAFTIDEVTTKSYGVYGRLRGDSILYFKMVDTVPGEDLSVSLQTNTRDETVHYDAVIWRPGYIENCTSEWYGWSTHGLPDGINFVRDKSGIPSILGDVIGDLPLIHVHGQNGLEKEFEPFGVGVYRPVGACNTTFPDNGDYYVAIFKPPHEEMGDVHFSLGIGMKEYFFPEIFEFPWNRALQKAGDWSVRWTISYVVQWGGVLDALIYLVWVYFHKKKMKPHSLSVIAIESYFMSCGVLMIVNALVFSLNLPNCAMQLDNGFQNESWLIPVIVQILIPFALGVTILYTQYDYGEYILLDVGTYKTDKGSISKAKFVRQNKGKLVGVFFAAAYFYFFVVYNIHAIVPLLMACGSIYLMLDLERAYRDLRSNVPGGVKSNVQFTRVDLQ